MSNIPDILLITFPTFPLQVMCREGYRSANGVIRHLLDVMAPLDRAVEMVGEGGLMIWAVGPEEELDKLRPVIGDLGTVFWTLDTGALLLNKF